MSLTTCFKFGEKGHTADACLVRQIQLCPMINTIMSNDDVVEEIEVKTMDLEVELLEVILSGDVKKQIFWSNKHH